MAQTKLTDRCSFEQRPWTTTIIGGLVELLPSDLRDWLVGFRRISTGPSTRSSDQPDRTAAFARTLSTRDLD